MIEIKWGIIGRSICWSWSYHILYFSLRMSFLYAVFEMIRWHGEERRRGGGGRVQRRWTRVFTLSVEETGQVTYLVSLLPHLAPCSFSYFNSFRFQTTVSQVHRFLSYLGVECGQWWCRPWSLFDILLDLLTITGIQNQQVRDEDWWWRRTNFSPACSPHLSPRDREGLTQTCH